MQCVLKTIRNKKPKKEKKKNVQQMNSILESCQIKYNKDSTQDLVEMLIPKEGKHRCLRYTK